MPVDLVDGFDGYAGRIGHFLAWPTGLDPRMAQDVRG
jgi:hypothetical protein